MSLARSPKQYTGVRPINPPNVIYADRGPTGTDVAYVRGDFWLDIPDAASYQYAGAGVWISLGSGTIGAVDTLTGGSGGAIAPTGGTISILGTANQLTSTGNAGAHSITFSIPTTFITPGTIASTTTITAGTALIATTSVTAGTSITATLGNITATNGNVVLGTAGNKIVIATGSNASVGTSAAMGGTPGTVTVATTASSATAKIFYARATTGGTPGQVSITAQDGTGFTLTSTGNETSTFNWWIINA
jgi:hypothetical protein